MKKITLFSVLFLCMFLVSEGAFAVRGYVGNFVNKGVSGWDVTGYGALGDASTDDSAAFTATIAAAAGSRVIVPEGTYKLSSNVTIPAGVSVYFHQGGLLSIDNGITFSVARGGSLEAGIYQIFSGSGTASLGKATCPYVLPQWWGAVPGDGTECTPAFNLALTAANTVGRMYIPSGTYKISTPIINFSSQNWYNHTGGPIIEGAGMEDTILEYYGTEGYVFELENKTQTAGQGPNYVTIKDLQIQAPSININNYGHSGGGVLLGAASENLIQNVAFTNIDETYGIAIHVRDRNVVDEVTATARDANIDFGTTGGGANEKYALKFTASLAGALRHVTVRLGITGAPAGTVEAHLYSDSAGPNAQIGSASGSTTINTISSAADGEDIDFEFDTAPPVATATDYWLVFKTTGYTYADGVTELRLRVDDGDGSADTLSTYDAAWSFEGATSDAGYDLEVVVREGQGVLNRLDRCMAYGAERAAVAVQIEEDNQAMLTGCDFYTQDGLVAKNFNGLMWIHQSQFSSQPTGRPISINLTGGPATGGVTHWSMNYIEGGSTTFTSYFSAGIHTFEGNELSTYLDSLPRAQMHFKDNRGPLFYFTTDATKRHEDLDYFIGSPGSYGLTLFGVDSAGVVDAGALTGTAFELADKNDYVRWTFMDNLDYIYKLLAPGTYRYTVYAKSDGDQAADMAMYERIESTNGKQRYFGLTSDYRPYSIIVTLALANRGNSVHFHADKVSATVDSTIHISHFILESIGEAEPLRRDLFAFNQETSDGDGDRQSALWFYGIQSGGEQRALAAFRASHDGVADDAKAKLEVLVNDGNDGFLLGVAAYWDSVKDTYLSGDLTISGDDLKMATNTDTFILVADGTEYSPVEMTGDVTITNAGVTTITAADDIIYVTDVIPDGDGTDNAVTDIRRTDRTANRLYNRTTGITDTQDMDWCVLRKLPATATGISGLDIYTRASDFANCTMTITLEDQDGNVDATINGTDINPGSNDTWVLKELTPGSAYTAGELIWIKISIGSLDTADTVDFGEIILDL